MVYTYMSLSLDWLSSEFAFTKRSQLVGEGEDNDETSFMDGLP
jgi:hypothetical protein